MMRANVIVFLKHRCLRIITGRRAEYICDWINATRHSYSKIIILIYAPTVTGVTRFLFIRGQLHLALYTVYNRSTI